MSHHCSARKKTRKGKDHKRRHKNQTLIHPNTQESNKNSKLEEGTDINSLVQTFA